MRKRLRTIKEKLGIPSGRAIVHLFIVEGIIAIFWNWISKLFSIVLVREIGFLVVFVAGLFSVAWYLPKLSPQFGGLKPKKAQKPTTTPRRLEHDGVMWEDEESSSNGVTAIGPLCPKDLTPLGTELQGKKQVTAIDSTLISSSGFHAELYCPECNTKYNLGKDPKRIVDSRNEVSSRFKGIKRRDQES